MSSGNPSVIKVASQPDITDGREYEFFRELTHLIVLTTELTLSPYVLYAMPNCRPLILMIVEVQAHRRLVLLAVVHRPYAPPLAVFYPR
jgi:hypothetical protein